MRTIIDLPEELRDDLARFCEREGLSRAEAVRQAIHMLLQRRSSRLQERERAVRAAFGSWKEYGIDAVEYQREIRAEWDRE